MRTIYILMVLALATAAVVAGFMGPSHAQEKADVSVTIEAQAETIIAAK